jgi:apolipoprotein N-acyltransferase
MTPAPDRSSSRRQRLLAPWRAPWPWLSLLLLLLCTRSEPPRLWFWFSLLLISLLVGLLQSLARRP